MENNYKETLTGLVEGLNDYQLRIVLGFVRTLFKLEG